MTVWLLLSLTAIGLKRGLMWSKQRFKLNPLKKNLGRDQLTPSFCCDLLPLFFDLPGVVKVTCYQPSEGQGHNTCQDLVSPHHSTGTAACVCAGYVECICDMLRDATHPRTSTSLQLRLGRDPELAGIEAVLKQI